MAVEKLRRYELIYLVHPEAEDGQIGRMKDRVSQVLTDFNALVLKREDWGKRKLAYEVEKVNKAYYRYIEFISQPAMISELERVLRLVDVVIRYQTIRLEDNIPADTLDRFEALPTSEDNAAAVPEAAPVSEAAPVADAAPEAEEAPSIDEVADTEAQASAESEAPAEGESAEAEAADEASAVETAAAEAEEIATDDADAKKEADSE